MITVSGRPEEINKCLRCRALVPKMCNSRLLPSSAGGGMCARKWIAALRYPPSRWKKHHFGGHDDGPATVDAQKGKAHSIYHAIK